MLHESMRRTLFNPAVGVFARWISTVIYFYERSEQGAVVRGQAIFHTLRVFGLKAVTKVLKPMQDFDSPLSMVISEMETEP